MKIQDQMHLYQSLGFLLQAGLPLLNALEKIGLSSMVVGIQEGRSLAEVLQQHQCHLPCVQMIRIGEQSGSEHLGAGHAVYVAHCKPVNTLCVAFRCDVG